jgi:hypothetical protein
VNGKEKLKAAFEHREGPVPIDFGSNAVTGMHVSVVAQLREYYGLEKIPVKVIEPYQMLGEIDDELKDLIGIDVEGIYSNSTIFGFENTGWKEWQTPWKQNVLVPKDFNTSIEGEDTVIYPQGDMTSAPSGRMPSTGYFFDTIIRQNPIVDSELNPEDNLEEFKFIDEETLSYYKEECAKLENNDRGVIANFGGTGLGDIALVPAPFLKDPKGIRDITEWYMSTMIRRDYLHEIFNRQIDIAIANYEKIYSIVGESVQAAFICGTDFGTQNSLFCSTDTFKELYYPHYKRMNDWIHKNTGWKVFKHSCGAVEPLIELFIESGFEIINPVQISATGMDPQNLKSKYGDRVVFWGGGVDTQKTLPFGTVDEVRTQVLELCNVFAVNGGFIFNAIHNIQAKTPILNIVAMINAVNEFNGNEI